MRNILEVISRFKESRIVIIDKFNEFGGADYPIRNYLRYLEKMGERTYLIRFMDQYGTISLFLALVLSNKILVNGLRPFNYWRLVIFVLLKRKAIIYLHETEWVFNNYRNINKIKYKVLSRILHKRVVLCSSKAHQSFIEDTFGAQQTHLVYNNIGDRFSIDRTEGVLNILMVGSVQARKGVTLFSELADYAISEGEPWKFIWIGGRTFDAPDLYFSENVEWLGHADHVVLNDCIGKSDLFFLASADDPFPLSCLEALSQFKKCVAYVGTGTAEIISDIEGCAVYSAYAVEAAFDAIKKALSEELELEKVTYVNNHISSVSSFAERMKDIF